MQTFVNAKLVTALVAFPIKLQTFKDSETGSDEGYFFVTLSTVVFLHGMFLSRWNQCNKGNSVGQLQILLNIGLGFD